MKYGAIAVLGTTSLLVVTILLTSINPAFADGSYEKSRVIPQVNGCGNYWFPVNIIWSNLNSQAQSDENDVAMATTTLQIQTMGLHFPRSLHLMTQRQCAEVDEIADYMVMSAFMIYIQ